MRIYIDFDDVITETAKRLSAIAHELFGTNVEYENISTFYLNISFGLDKVQLAKLMERAHSREEVLGYPETPGASAAIRQWLNDGHNVEIVTGRPQYTASATREWLADHGLADVKVIHVDKFRREAPPSSPDAPRSLTIDEFCQRRYDFAVEDSPAAFPVLERIQPCPVAVFSRPWNKAVEMPSSLYRRCADWEDVKAYALELASSH